MSEAEKHEKYKNVYIRFKPKIFGIGLNKTGLSYLGNYFEQLGYKLYCEPTLENVEIAKKNPDYFDSVIKKYDMFYNFPWPLLYKYIYDKYPSSKFILTIRETKIWIDSLQHFMRAKLPNYQSQNYIKIYNNYHENVMLFFKSRDNDRLLVLHTDDTNKEEKIRNFIGREYPQLTWENARKTIGGGKMPIKLLDYDYYFINIPKNASTLFIKTLCGDNKTGYVMMKLIDDINIVKKTITLTRNPFDRLYLIYSYLKLGREIYSEKNDILFKYVQQNTFESFVNDLYSGKLKLNNQIYLTPQYKFIEWKDGKIHNILIKIENLSESLTKLLGDKIIIPKINESTDWEKHYTPDMKKKVYSLYKTDFKLLGYSNYEQNNHTDTIKYIFAKNAASQEYVLALFKKFKDEFAVKITSNDTKIRHYRGNHIDSTITFVNNLDFDVSILTEYFIEDVRLECKNINSKLTPIDYYNKYKYEINKSYKQLIMSERISNTNKIEQYYAFKRNMKKYVRRDCDVFPLFVSMSIYCVFKPRDVLDMSAGWGDRLISAIAYGDCNYQGFDPNSKLTSRYKNIINTLAPNSDKTYNVIESPFENAQLTKQYDMMFSCPPYFIAEHYSNDDNQSYKKYSNIDEWLNNFMYKSVDIIWQHLITGGFFIFVLNNVRIGSALVKFTGKVLNYISSKNGAKFINMLKYETPQTIQPIWCFQKLSPINKTIFDKPYVIQPVSYSDKKFNVIREDFLIGGTKQRIIGDILDTIDKKNIIYREQVTGYAQIAISYGCYVKNKQAHIIVNRQHNKLYVSMISKIFNATIHEIEKPIDKIDEQRKVNEIASKIPDNYIMPVGLHTQEIINSYVQIFNKLKTLIEPKRMWIVTSHGTITDALLTVFPNTIFNVVFVGRQRDDYRDNKRINVYISTLSAKHISKDKPPYRSELTYDAKAWEFIKKYGENEDYILNVA